MKPKTVVLLGVAVVCGLIAAFLVSMATATSKPVDMVTVLVAAQELRQGTVLNDLPKQFVQTQVPPTAVPVGAITDPKQLEGMQMARTLDKGAIPTQGAVTKWDGLDKNLPPNHRALSIRVQMDTAVAGFILPGARVDLICAMEDAKHKGQGLKLAKIFMQDVLVLAMNTKDVRDEKGRLIPNPSTATLALTPQQVEKVTRVLSDNATIWLALRKPDDRKQERTMGNFNPFLDDKKGAEAPEEDVDVYVAAEDIPANTEINDGNFKDLFVLKKFTSSTKPPSAFSKDGEKEIRAAGKVYTFLPKGAPLTRYNLTEPKKEDPVAVKTNEPKAEERHVMWIFNGSQGMEFIFRGRRADVGPPDVPVGPNNPNQPGSEGK